MQRRDHWWTHSTGWLNYKTTVNTLYKSVKQCMEEDGLEIENLVGIGCDGANSMVDSHNSLAILLKNNIPNLTVFLCICHSLNLAASKASEGLPTVLSFIVCEIQLVLTSSQTK